MAYPILVRWHLYIESSLWCIAASKQRDSGLNLTNRSDIWQTPRQQRCRDACRISKRCNHYNIQPRGFESSRGLPFRDSISDTPPHEMILRNIWCPRFILTVVGSLWHVASILSNTHGGSYNTDPSLSKLSPRGVHANCRMVCYFIWMTRVLDYSNMSMWKLM